MLQLTFKAGLALTGFEQLGRVVLLKGLKVNQIFYFSWTPCFHSLCFQEFDIGRTKVEEQKKSKGQIPRFLSRRI